MLCVPFIRRSVDDVCVHHVFRNLRSLSLFGAGVPIDVESRRFPGVPPPASSPLFPTRAQAVVVRSSPLLGSRNALDSPPQGDCARSTVSKPSPRAW